jgi:hypothetical protein
MEKKAKIGDEVLILDVPWQDDKKYIGSVRKLKGRESGREYAYTYGNYRGHTIVVSKYVLATELNKALS